MRKFLIFAIMILPFAIQAQSFEFKKEGNRLGWNFTGGTVDVSQGNYIFSLDGSTKTPNIRKSKLKADDSKYLHVVLKNNTKGLGATMIKMSFKTEDKKVIYLRKDITNMDSDFVTYTFDLGSLPEWTGTKNLNLRFWNRKEKIEGVIIINRIVFNNNSTL